MINRNFKKVNEVRNIGALHTLPCIKSLVEEVVLLQNVITYVSLIYDCAVGDCTRREIKVSKAHRPRDSRCSGENVFFFFHKKNHKLYFVKTLSLLLQRK